MKTPFIRIVTSSILPILIFVMSGSGCISQWDKEEHVIAQRLSNVTEHFASDTLKTAASEFLLSNMVGKRSYRGELLDAYDTIFSIFDSLRHAGVKVGDPPVIKNTWKKLHETYGDLLPDRLHKLKDAETISPDFLIRHIEQAFKAWDHAPDYAQCDFNTFCEYILPYRIGSEAVEDFRDRYYSNYHLMCDTAQSFEALLQSFNKHFSRQEYFKTSETLWEYKMDLSISQMEKGHRGACRHLCAYCAQVMRSCGLPVAVDLVKAWGNRNNGHSWNALVLGKDSIFPFDAMSSSPLRLSYKPAKIFRKMFSLNHLPADAPTPADAPLDLLRLNELDVTHLYGKTHDVTIRCKFPYQGDKKKQHGVICVFDNKVWHPVYWGKIDHEMMTFKNMMGDVCYMAAYYDNGLIQPASDPFILSSEGEIRYLMAEHCQKLSMTLKRKYPRFERMETHAMKLRRSKVEATNDPTWGERTLLFDQYSTPHDVNDSIVDLPRKFRYVRWRPVIYRTGDLAEVEFYGRRNDEEEETKLKGEIIGHPAPDKATQYPYTNAMDGDPATFFSKPKNQEGYVGLDLGAGNEAYITRVHFHPRSDTNHIVIGDEYELCYWDSDHWHSCGVQVASGHELTFHNIPKGAIYLLHNHSRGKEERIFTYENGEQIWW